MTIYILDTNILSKLYSMNRDERDYVVREVAGLGPVGRQFVSAVTIGELRYGSRLFDLSARSKKG